MSFAKLGQAFRVVSQLRPDHARKFAQHMVPHVVRPAQILWNQAIGGIFVLFAVSFLSYGYMHRDNGAALAFSIILGVIMAWFGLSSFLKARRLSRL